jgi:hypothetical protein
MTDHMAPSSSAIDPTTMAAHEESIASIEELRRSGHQLSFARIHEYVDVQHTSPCSQHPSSKRQQQPRTNSVSSSLRSGASCGFREPRTASGSYMGSPRSTRGLRRHWIRAWRSGRSPAKPKSISSRRSDTGRCCAERPMMKSSAWMTRGPRLRCLSTARFTTSCRRLGHLLRDTRRYTRRSGRGWRGWMKRNDRKGLDCARHHRLRWRNGMYTAIALLPVTVIKSPLQEAAIVSLCT